MTIVAKNATHCLQNAQNAMIPSYGKPTLVKASAQKPLVIRPTPPTAYLATRPVEAATDPQKPNALPAKEPFIFPLTNAWPLARTNSGKTAQTLLINYAHPATKMCSVKLVAYSFFFNV